MYINVQYVKVSPYEDRVDDNGGDAYVMKDNDVT
jgi:hypothetical protein